MYYARSGLNPVIASLAVLILLLSGGVFAYSTRIQSSSGASSAQPLDGGSNYPQSLSFLLVPASVSSTHAGGYGKVGLVVQGLSALTSLTISGGIPRTQLMIVMLVNSSAGSHSVNLGNVTLSDGGSGGFYTKTQFDSPGTYQVGFQVYDVSASTTPSLVLVSMPAFAEVTVDSNESSSSTYSEHSTTTTTTSSYSHQTTTTSTTTETTTEPSGGQYPSRLGFELVPAPVWQHQTVPQNYPLQRGEAVIYTMVSQIFVRVSFLGTPGTEYTVVLQKNNDNITLGALTTDSNGGGVFTTKISMDPGTYQFGLLLYVTASVEQGNLVALSNPRSASGVVLSGTVTSTTTTTTTTTTRTQTTETETGHQGGGNTIAYQLISLPAYLLTAQPENYPFKSGGAFIKADGTAIQVLVSFGGTPDTHFLVDLTVNGQNSTIGDVVTNHDGGAYLKKTVPLGQGTFQLGFLIFAETSANTQQTLVGLSMPRTQTVQLPLTVTTTTTTTTSSQNENQQGPSLKFALLPVPVWQGNTLPDNYAFRMGGASVGLDGTTLHIIASFIGAPNTTFAFVLTDSGVNKSIGSVTTNSEGGGTLESSVVSVDPGDHRFGILVFSPTADQPSNLVAVSIPRVQTASISNGGSSTNSSFEPRTFGFRLNPAPGVASASGSHRPGSGEAGGIFADGYIAIYASIIDASPNTHYALLFTVNGTEHDIGNFVTDNKGQARIVTGLKVGNGTLVVGMRVNDTSSFSAPTAVMVSDPPKLVLSSQGVETRVTATTTESQGGQQQEGKSVLRFTIVGAKVPNAPAGYSIGNGAAYIKVDGQTLQFNMGVTHANPNTQYDVSLSINGTSTHVGSLITDQQGEGQLTAGRDLTPGTYMIGVLVYDTSTFTAPTLVMFSDPTVLAVVIVSTASSSTSTATTAASSTSESSRSLTTIVAGNGDEESIKLAVSSLTIPAVVHVGTNNASFSVIDPRFSVAVGRQGNDGIIVSISAANVTGPRILLLNLTQNSFLKIKGNALNVTLDGNPVAQASSVTQVLNPLAGDPARYVVVATSSGLQVLISIPHFSLHLIQIVPIPVSQLESFLIVNAEALVASILVITIVFAAIYKTRRKLLSVFL